MVILIARFIICWLLSSLYVSLSLCIGILPFDSGNTHTHASSWRTPARTPARTHTHNRLARTNAHAHALCLILSLSLSPSIPLSLPTSFSLFLSLSLFSLSFLSRCLCCSLPLCDSLTHTRTRTCMHARISLWSFRVVRYGTVCCTRRLRCGGVVLAMLRVYDVEVYYSVLQSTAVFHCSVLQYVAVVAMSVCFWVSVSVSVPTCISVYSQVLLMIDGQLATGMTHAAAATSRPLTVWMSHVIY